MTLNTLRIYYVLLIAADQLFWSLTPLADAVVRPVQTVCALLRIALFVVALLPRRFRLTQVRALRLVSLYAFIVGACAAWSARAALDGNPGWWFITLTPEACTAAYILSAAAVAVLLLNAVLLPRTRWL